MTFEGFVASLQRYNHFRLPYVRRYPSDAIWRGYLSSLAISELEQAGNTVRRMGGYYVLNSTAPMDPVRAELIGTAQAAEGVL